jgi:hypothetical protein
MLKDMGALFKQAKEVQSKMTEMQESLSHQNVEASVGGGMVRVIVNGNSEVLSVKIEEELINMKDKAILEDLLVGAINEAMRKANVLKQTEMGKITGGMKIPGLFGS